MPKINVHLDQWINYNPNVGINQLHIVGLPGTGKSNMANSLAFKCMREKNERLLMPGDRFCEWRHFINHPRWKENKFKYKVFIPEGDLFYHQIPKKISNGFIKTNINELDLMEHFDDDTRLIVVYDQHLPRSKRTRLWTNYAEQILNRITFLDSALILLFHEAGNYFQEGARDELWKAIDDFSELFVEFRKGLIRCILVSQLQTEIRDTVRKKCLERIFRQGTTSRKEPKRIIKSTPFLRIHEYNHIKGGLYVTNNKISKFIENNSIWKMVPRGSFNEGEDPPIGSVKIPSKGNYIVKNGVKQWDSRDSSGRYVSVGET